MKIIRFFSSQMVIFSVFLISAIPFISKCSALQENLHNDNNDQDDREHQDPRINKIITSEPWQNYKQIWIALDRDRDFYSDSVKLYSFSDMSAYDTFSISLDQIMIDLDQLEEQGLLNPLEVDILENIVRSRIKYQSGYLHMVRMMPAPLEYNKEDVLNNLDARIDTLVALRDNGVVTEEMTDTLLSNILLDFERFVYMDAISAADPSYYVYDDYMDSIPDFNKQLDLYELRFAELRDSGHIEDSLYNQYLINIDSIRQKLVALDTLLPRMEPLFRDLVNYDI